MISRGKDSLLLQVANLAADSIDLLYSIDGQLMPPILDWHLDGQQTAKVFVDWTTLEGEYRFLGIRPHGNDPSEWIRINARATVR